MSSANSSPIGALRNLDLNLLPLFEALYSEGSQTAAAARLGLTQPAVSHALARLRTALADPLFVRRGARMTPTPFARSIIEDVRRALNILQDRLQDGRRFDPLTSLTTFRLGLRETSEHSLLPNLMNRLALDAPHTTVLSARLNRRDVESELASGHMDLAIDVAAPVGLDIRREILTGDSLVVVLRRRHPTLKRPFDLEAYLRLRHVLVSSRRRGGAVEDFELNRIGERREIALRCHSTLAALEVVAASDLLLTLGRRQLASLNAPSDLRVLPLPFSAAPVDLEMYWHSNLDNDPASLWLRDIVRRIAKA